MIDSRTQYSRHQTLAHAFILVVCASFLSLSLLSNSKRRRDCFTSPRDNRHLHSKFAFLFSIVPCSWRQKRRKSNWLWRITDAIGNAEFPTKRSIFSLFGRERHVRTGNYLKNRASAHPSSEPWKCPKRCARVWCEMNFGLKMINGVYSRKYSILTSSRDEVLSFFRSWVISGLLRVICPIFRMIRISFWLELVVHGGVNS